MGHELQTKKRRKNDDEISTSYRSRSWQVNCSMFSSTFRSCNMSSSSLRYGLCSLGVATDDFPLVTVVCKLHTTVTMIEATAVAVATGRHS